MTKRQQPTRVLITDTKVKAARPAEGVVRVWDTKVPGFHLRITPAGGKSFCVTFQRADGQKVNVTLGSAEAWTVDDPKPVHGAPVLDSDGNPKIGARTWAEGLRKLHEQGKDVRAHVKAERSGQDLRALVKVWREDYRPRLKPTSQVSYDSLLKDKGEGRDKARIGPLLDLLGTRQVKDLTYADVKALHKKVQQGGHDTNANRAVAVLSRLLSIAEKEGWRPRNSNPCHQLEKPSEKPRDRVATVAELAALASALCDLEAAWVMEVERKKIRSLEKSKRVDPKKGPLPGGAQKTGKSLDPQAADLIRFLMLSGLRKAEAQGLKFTDVDLERGVMRFERHKTDEQMGTKVLPLNSHLKAIIQRRSTERLGPYVFPGRNLSGPIVGLSKMWLRAVERAKITNLKIHDLRHTFMTTCTELGYPLAIGDALLGHSLGRIQDTYVNLGSEGILATATRETADWIAAAMAGEKVKPGLKVIQVAN